MRRILTLFAALLLTSASTGAQAPQRLRGFSAQGSEAERTAEAKFQAVPKPENAREYMQKITAKPHHAGSPASREVAEYILGLEKSWGLDARIESFEALMPYPTERQVELVAPERYTLKLAEPAVPQDPSSDDASGLPTFNAYSADGDVTAELVYVNFGTPDDYE